MDEKMVKILSALENGIKIQRESVIRGDPSKDYMHGMLNGMIWAHSTVSNSAPIFYTAKGRPRRPKIRHKLAHRTKLRSR